jgi:hypothetical protein
MPKSLALISMLIVVQLSAPGLADEPPTQSDSSPEAGGKLPLGPIMLGSLGLVGVAVGSGLGWQAKQEYDQFNESNTGVADPFGQASDKAYPNASDELADDIENHALAANILMFAGIAAAGGAIIWWLVDDDYKEKNKVELETAAWHPEVGPGHLGLRVEF